MSSRASDQRHAGLYLLDLRNLVSFCPGSYRSNKGCPYRALPGGAIHSRSAFRLKIQATQLEEADPAVENVAASSESDDAAKKAPKGRRPQKTFTVKMEELVPQQMLSGKVVRWLLSVLHA